MPGEQEVLEELTTIWLYQIPDGEENGLDGEPGTPSGMLFYATTEATAEEIKELGYPIEKVVHESRVQELEGERAEALARVETRIEMQEHEEALRRAAESHLARLEEALTKIYRLTTSPGPSYRALGAIRDEARAALHFREIKQ